MEANPFCCYFLSRSSAMFFLLYVNINRSPSFFSDLYIDGLVANRFCSLHEHFGSPNYSSSLAKDLLRVYHTYCFCNYSALLQNMRDLTGEPVPFHVFQSDHTQVVKTLDGALLNGHKKFFKGFLCRPGRFILY